MPARKSVIIGCGTTGSEIAAKVFVNFKKYAKETGEEEDKVQFLLVDTQDPVKGAEELYYRGDHLMIGVPRANEVLQAKKRHDRFFNIWWPDEYDFIPSLFPGAGTIPINGRLAFWTRLGSPALPDSFEKKFKEKAVSKDNSGGQQMKCIVFIICTLSGGTGAGIFLDIAQIIKDIKEIETEIYGVFLLQDIVNMRASTDVHEQTSANAYGSLIALNYWQTPQNMRDIDLGKFMQTPDKELEGNKPPFNICYLLSQINENGHSMSTIQDYQQMASDAVSMMLFEEQAGQIDARMSDNLSRIAAPLRLGRNNTPVQFGSFAAYSLSYHPEKAVSYLTSDLAVKTIDAFQVVPDKITDLVAENVKNYIELNQLREVDDDGQGARKNEVTDKIKSLDNSDMILYPVMQTIIQHLSVTHTATALITELTQNSTQPGNFKAVVKKFKKNVESGLWGKLQKQNGVNYHELMQSNRKKLYQHVVRRFVELDPSMPKQTTGLHQLIGWMLTDKELQLAGAKRLLELIQSEIPKHRESLEYELEGEKIKGITGDRGRLENIENSLDTALMSLEKTLFKGGKKKRLHAAQTFEEKWWKPWLQLKIDIMAKDEAVAFYTALENEIEWLLTFLSTDIADLLEGLKKHHDIEKSKLYGIGANVNADRREEETIVNGSVLTTAYKDKLNNSVKTVKDELAMLLVKEMDELIKQDERTLKERRDFLLKLKQSISTFISGEGKTIFDADLSELSLWESMVLGLDNPTEDRIKAYVEARIRKIRDCCVPHWQLDPGFRTQGQRYYTVPMYSYDSKAKSDFESKYEIELDIQSAAAGAAGVDEILGVEQSAYQASAYELRILVIQSGVPLHYITPVSYAQDEFERRMEKSTQPCIVDKRYQRLIDRHIPTWDPMTDINVVEETVYYLLMAEHLGILESPMLSKTKSPHGTYKYRSNTLKSTRYRAFEQLLPGGEYYSSLTPEIKKMVDLREKDYAEKDWMKEHLICYQRLNVYLEEAPQTAAKKEVSKHRDILEIFIKDKYRLDKVEILKKLEDESITPTYFDD